MKWLAHFVTLSEFVHFLANLCNLFCKILNTLLTILTLKGVMKKDWMLNKEHFAVMYQPDDSILFTTVHNLQLSTVEFHVKEC